jgi:hypothetical protein
MDADIYPFSFNKTGIILFKLFYQLEMIASRDPPKVTFRTENQADPVQFGA